VAESPAFLRRPAGAGYPETPLFFDKEQRNDRQEFIYFAERKEYVVQQVRCAPGCENCLYI
jgi:hypothetical protein